MNRCPWVAALVLLAVAPAGAQNSQFFFDLNGNLLVQTAETSGLPQILVQPANQVVMPGAVASFAVVAADTRGVTYQWRFNGADTGGGGDSLLVPNVGATNEGLYSVVLSNFFGSVTSAPANLWLDSRGCGMPDFWQLAWFGNLTNLPTADADGDGISNLQEFLDGTNPTNSASARYHLTLFSDGGVIQVVPNLATYNPGDVVTLTASPSNSFHGWTGDVSTHSNSLTLTMTTNRSEFAHFQPIDFAFTNSSGDWTVATNWSPNLVPGYGDNVHVFISAAITLNTNADCGTLFFGGPNTVPGLAGTGTLTVHGPAVWNSGSLNGSGRLVIAPQGSLAFANSPLSVGLSGWSLENGGTIQVYGTGGIGLASGTIITNRPGALFDLQVPTAINYLTGSGVRFDNAGTFRKSIAPGTNTIGVSVPFNNFGSIELQTGTLLFNGAAFTNAGSVMVSAGALLCNGSMANNGMVSLSPGTTALLTGGGSASGSFTTPPTALVQFGGGFTLNPGAQLNGAGLYRVASAANLAVNTDVPIQNVDLLGTLSGTGLVTVSDALSWTGGSMSGSGRTLIAPGASLNLSNASNVSLSRTLENGGTVLCLGGGALSGTTGIGIITNRLGALFEVRTNTLFAIGLSACRFDNAGTFRKSSSIGTNTFAAGFPFNNYGIVDIQSGTVHCNDVLVNNGTVTLAPGTTNRLMGGGSATGTFTCPAGSLVEFSAGIFTVNPGAQLNGAGLYRISGSGSVHANTDVSIQNLDLSFLLDGSGSVTVSNTLNWTAGSMGGGGRTVIAPVATLNLSSPGGVTLSRTLENGGTTLCTGAGGLSGTTGLCIITNRPGALFEMRNDASFSVGIASCRFDNAGTFRKYLSTGTNTFNSGFSFNNYGVVDLQAGTLAASGGYISSSSAVFNSAIGGTVPGTNFGRLQVSGAVTLNGGLSVALVNGYLPTTNDSFAIVTAGTRIGNFSSFSYPSNQVTMQLSNTTSSVIVRVAAVTAPPPAPLLLIPLLSGTNVLLAWVAVSNTTYRVESNPDLIPSNWAALPGDVTALSSTASKLDALTPSNRFYRVRVIP